MQINFKAIALSSIALCATAAFAANTARVEVPFSFSAQGQSYPAGSYEVALNTNQSVVTLQSKSDPTAHFSWTVGPADAATSPAVVKFDQVGSYYALKNIQMDNKVTPSLNKTNRGISATTSIGGQ
jgi:hypothetical protein